jgi:hypothetical protein
MPLYYLSLQDELDAVAVTVSCQVQLNMLEQHLQVVVAKATSCVP